MVVRGGQDACTGDLPYLCLTHEVHDPEVENEVSNQVVEESLFLCQSLEGASGTHLDSEANCENSDVSETILTYLLLAYQLK